MKEQLLEVINISSFYYRDQIIELIKSSKSAEEARNSLKEIKKEFNYRDPFLLEEQLYEDEVLIRNTARDFATKELLPKIIEANRNDVYDNDLFKKLGKIGLITKTNLNYTNWAKTVLTSPTLMHFFCNIAFPITPCVNGISYSSR